MDINIQDVKKELYQFYENANDISVIVSTIYCGWYTTNKNEPNAIKLLFDSQLVNYIRENNNKGLTHPEIIFQRAKELCPTGYFAPKHLEPFSLTIISVPKNSTFSITEYDGMETLIFLSDFVFFRV